MDTRQLTRLLAAALAVHAVSAVAAYIGYTIRGSPDSLVTAVVCSLLLIVAVTTPYALFVWASYAATVKWAATLALLACAVAGSLALLAYAWAFELFFQVWGLSLEANWYVFVFLLVPAAQAIFAGAVLMVAYIARKRAKAL